MRVEKAGDNGRNGQPLKATSGAEMVSVQHFTSENWLAIYQKLLQLMLQVRGHKFNNQYLGFCNFTGYLKKKNPLFCGLMEAFFFLLVRLR